MLYTKRKEFTLVCTGTDCPEREVDAPSLEMLQVRLDGAKMSLLTAGGLD